MKLCVFPNDPLVAYYKKGEIKDRYYNPNNFFDEVHFISFTDNDVEESKVQTLVGNAHMKIHNIGKIGISNRRKHVEKIVHLISKINPDIIRAYNTLLEGWFAATWADELGIPFFLSLHTQYDYNRKLTKKKNIKKFLALKYTERFVEPFVLKKANKITAVFKIIEPYVLKHIGKKPEILYNKADLEKFQKASLIKTLPKPLIISVGRLTDIKNHQILVKAMKEINANLLIIGDGELYDNLINLIKKLKLEKKIQIKKSVPNKEIQNYYKSSQIFALAYTPELEGIPLPIIEAMATGLPIIIPFLKPGFEEGLERVALFSHPNPKSFSENIKKLLDNNELLKEFSEKSLIKSHEFDSKKIEARECEIYSELMEIRHANSK